MPLVDALPSWTLAELNQFVSEQETILGGPLTNIGNKDGKTTITINDLDPNGSPATHSVITTSAPPAGAKVIGAGKIYVSGTLTDATAYKP
jgi:hypothetical protein